MSLARYVNAILVSYGILFSTRQTVQNRTMNTNTQHNKLSILIKAKRIEISIPFLQVRLTINRNFNPILTSPSNNKCRCLWEKYIQDVRHKLSQKYWLPWPDFFAHKTKKYAITRNIYKHECIEEQINVLTLSKTLLGHSAEW